MDDYVSRETMTVNSVWYTTHSDSFVDGPLNYGPISVGGGAYVTRITVRGAVSSPGSTLGPTAYLVVWFQHGLQHVPSGTSPSNLEGGSFSPAQWFRAEGLTVPSGNAYWTPSTDSAAYLSGFGSILTWYGQYYLTEDVDIYYSVGRITDVGITASFWGSIEVNWAV